MKWWEMPISQSPVPISQSIKVIDVDLSKQTPIEFLNPFHLFYKMWVNSITFQADIVINDMEGNKLAYKQGDKWTIIDAEKAIEVLVKEIDELKNK